MDRGHPGAHRHVRRRDRATTSGSTWTPRRPRQGPFGAPIAHGYLTLSLFIPLFTELLDVQGVTTKVNYGLNKVRFPSPVKVGSRIRLVAKLTEVEEVPGGVQITVDGAIEIEGGAKPAAVLQSLSRFYA